MPIFTGWTRTGTSSINAFGYTGSYSAATGSAVATTGDSSVSQTFVIGTNGTLSFWYAISCPATVTYDWGTVTLRDNTVGTTTTVLPRTCPGPGNYVWRQLTFPVVAGPSYTLTLASHHDGYSSDPT